jgi:hypothetical protein
MRPHWPAAFRRVLAVGGLDDDYRPTDWSKRGHWLDVSTWGQGVVSTYVWGEEELDPTTNSAPEEWKTTDPTPWARWSGTSFSAPQVAGMIAARAAPRRNVRRITTRAALSELLGRGYWYEDKFGVVIPTPFLP